MDQRDCTEIQEEIIAAYQVHVPSSTIRELMSRHFGLHKARLVEATVTYIHTGKTGKKTRHGYCGFQMEFPACVG